MSAIIIDGLAVSKQIKLEVAQKTKDLKQKGVVPCLAVILVGDDAASVSYVTGKQKALEEAGIKDLFFGLKEDTTQQELLSLIQKLNLDDSVHGILVQLPLPRQIDTQKVIAAIDPKKDVDGFSPINAGCLVTGQKGFVPCTPLGIVELLKRFNIKTQGKHAVIVGRSGIVGKPLILLFLSKALNATVTVCHTGTVDLPFYTRQADILIAAAGHPHIIKASMLKTGSVVIDVGVNRIKDETKKKGFHLEGDVDFLSACQVASYITPVPGGVGPMTIAELLCNTLQAATNALINAV